MGYVKRMCVDASYRGKGVAQALMSTLVNFAIVMNYDSLYLATSTNMLASQKFYLKEGFELIPQLPEGFLTSGATIYYKKSLI